MTLKQWLVSINIYRQKTQSIVPPVLIRIFIVERVTIHKHLGMTFSTNLTWTKHTDETVGKSNRCHDMIKGFTEIIFKYIDFKLRLN